MTAAVEQVVRATSVVIVVCEVQLSSCQFIDENRAALDTWKMDVSIEDSMSGNVHIAAFCDPLITELLGEIPSLYLNA